MDQQADSDTHEIPESYGIERWGVDYFSISANGEVCVKAPTDNGTYNISLKTVVDGLIQRGLDMPVMLRLDNLVYARIKELNEGFSNAMAHSGYQGTYRGVFPIKVNQQSHVVERIAEYGSRYNHGLEAGSKAELLIAMSMLNNTEALIVCNGYKDAEFIDLGLQAIRLGFKCFFVVESVREVETIVERSKHWNIKPLIGLRLKLAVKVEGHWAADSGDRSLFGLSTLQMIECIDRLKQADMLDCLQLLHSHLGSQIPNIRNIRDGVMEACRYYVNIVGEGAALKYLDLGGGLAVDYDGSGSLEGHSRNYTLNEYCVDIIESVQESLDKHQIPHPVIITESGRATVAPMSVLLFNVLDVGTFDPRPSTTEASGIELDANETLQCLNEAYQNITARRAQERYNDACYYRDRAQDAFIRGEMSLRERAACENLYLSILQKVAALAPQLNHQSTELNSLKDLLSDIYYCNFSVFQSLPDAWAIDQLFPVMPIHRLNETPTRRAILADLTCDCDGKIDRFIDGNSESKTIALHQIKDNEEYYLGVFLVGAYQETLGDLHNLFGDTHVASVCATDDGKIEFVHELEGDSIEDVLSYVEYEPKALYNKFRSTAERAVRNDKITVAERQQMLRLFQESLQGYTYFER